MLKFRELQTQDLDSLSRFCKKCEDEGLKNNSSFEVLKLNEIKYWIIEEKGDIIGISGCHIFPEVSPNAYRILVRSCMLPDSRIPNASGLFRNITLHEPIFKYLAPLQIEWAKQLGGKEFIITTNPEQTESWKTKMVQTDRVSKILQKQNIVSLFRENAEVYFCKQNIWRLNEDQFWLHRQRAGLERIGSST